MEQLQAFDGGTCGTSDLTDVLATLRKLALRTHEYCEDGWYSCPKAEDGCYDERRGPECDCGADEHNAEVEKVFSTAMRLVGANVEVSGCLPNNEKGNAR